MSYYGTFTELDHANRYCTCCQRDLTGHAFRWLELDQRTNTYHDFGGVPEDRSQGWFPFGLKCAKRLITKAKHLNYNFGYYVSNKPCLSA
jgi:hypothetical protein